MPLKDHKLLLTVGRFVERKGHRWFIKNVLPEITNRVIYVAIGDGPELQNVKDEVEKSVMNKNIFILGRQPDTVLKQAYAAADLFIMPNIPVEGDMEGFGIVMLEANLAGTPVVASDLEGIRDVIKEGENGYKIPIADEQEFSKRIDKLLSDNLNLLSDKSRKTVQKYFSWAHVAELYLNFLEQQVYKYG